MGVLAIPSLGHVGGCFVPAWTIPMPLGPGLVGIAWAGEVPHLFLVAGW